MKNSIFDCGRPSGWMRALCVVGCFSVVVFGSTPVFAQKGRAPVNIPNPTEATSTGPVTPEFLAKAPKTGKIGGVAPNFLSYRTIWAVENIAEPDHIAKFTSGTPGTVTSVGSTGIPSGLFAGLDFGGDGVLYGYSEGANIGLYSINQTTGAATFIGSSGLDAGYGITDISWDPNGNRMLAVAYTGNPGVPSQLYTINLSNGVFTKLGNITGTPASFIPIGLATAANGTNYVLDIATDTLYAVSGLAATALPNPIGFNANFSQGITIDWSGDGECYYGAVNSTTNTTEFRTINLTTGVSTLIGPIQPLAGNLFEAGDVAIRPPAGPLNVNSQVTFVETTQGLTGIAGSCATAGYTNQYNINVDLTNIGTNTFTSPFFSVIELQEANGAPPANPFRLRTADDFNNSNCTGGLIGTTQAIPGPVAPNQVIPVNFQIAMPQLRRFRFIVSVFAVVSGGANHRTHGQPTRMGQLAVEATGFDKAGTPVLTATFIPEKGAPATFKVGSVTATTR